ncbi:MAG: MBL fold metallo-hydrolase [Desulfomicrobium escambiense]|nr:MBL fold metallo-hydrolase [Desulfomicrobium escambiense]
MNDITAIDYERAVEIAKGVYWVGFYDTQSGLHCNPFLIVDGDEAVVIDGGSRPDFPTVMMKILQTGISPKQIRALIYQHYDPDLCGSLPSFEDIIGRKDLRVISAAASNMFIRHYAVKSKLEALENIGSRFEFSSGRVLQFIKTPYAHSQGSHVTFDAASGILFSSDLFGSYGSEWSLYLDLNPECLACSDFADCRGRHIKCPVRDILKFHEKLMPSEKVAAARAEKSAARAVHHDRPAARQHHQGAEHHAACHRTAGRAETGGNRCPRRGWLPVDRRTHSQKV